MRRALPVVCGAAFLGCIVAANYVTGKYGTIPVGFGLAVTAGTWFAGLTLVLRDGLNESLRRPLWWVVGLVAVGAVLSYEISPAQIALASATAFAVAELADYAFYQPLRRRSRAWAVLVSGLVGSAVDTALFLTIAKDAIEEQIHGPITPGLVVGQFLVKAFLSFVVFLALAARERR